MQLTEHFSLAELTATRTGIPNNPGPRAVIALQLLCVHVLELVRVHFGRPVRVSSGFRAPAVNAAVGGSPTSQHVFGEAADFTVAGVPNLSVCQWIQRELRFDQLIYEFGETGWIHASFRDGRLRQQELTARRIAFGRVRYLKGLVP